MLLDALAGVTLRNKNENEMKTLFENMFHNQYCSSDQTVKPNGMLAVDSNTTVLA